MDEKKLEDMNVAELSNLISDIKRVMRYETKLKWLKFWDIIPQYSTFDPRVGVFTPEEIEYYKLQGYINQTCIDKNTGRCVSNSYIHDHMFNYDPWIKTIKDLLSIARSNNNKQEGSYIIYGSIPDEGYYYCTFPCRKHDLLRSIINDKLNNK